MLDNSGLRELLGRVGEKSAQQILDEILGELEAYEVRDDVALLVVKQRPPSEAVLSQAS